jgi:hypothetical protein
MAWYLHQTHCCRYSKDGLLFSFLTHSSSVTWSNFLGCRNPKTKTMQNTGTHRHTNSSMGLLVCAWT